MISGGLRIARVDCDVELDICYRFDLEGYPTIMVLHDNYAYEYDGEPNVESFLEYILNQDYLESPHKVEFGRDRSYWELFRIAIGRVGYELVFLMHHVYALIGFGDIHIAIKLVGVFFIVIIPCMLLCVAFIFMGEEENTDEHKKVEATEKKGPKAEWIIFNNTLIS